MGRKSVNNIRKLEIVEAFSRVLATHGYAGATIVAIADEAKLSPGLIHHHFSNKKEILEELLNYLVAKFKSRYQAAPLKPTIDNYIEASLKLDHNSDIVLARCWVGVFAEAFRDPNLMEQVKRKLNNEIETIQNLSGKTWNDNQASALLAFIIGALVYGSLAPRKVAGFAEPTAKILAKFFS